MIMKRKKNNYCSIFSEESSMVVTSCTLLQTGKKNNVSLCSTVEEIAIVTAIMQKLQFLIFRAYMCVRSGLLEPSSNN